MLKLDMLEVQGLAKRVGQLGPAVKTKAIGRGLQKVANQGKTAAKREITREYNVKAGEVGRRLVVRLRPQAQQAVLVARSGNRNRIPLMAFGAKDTKKRGVRFRVRKGTGSQRLRHAFQATMPNGRTGIFQRVPGTRKIKEVVGIDITHMFAGRRVKPAVLQRINAVLPRVMQHELQYELDRALRRRGR